MKRAGLFAGFLVAIGGWTAFSNHTRGDSEDPARADNSSNARPAPSFPSAEGFGAIATGGRGGKVLIVDSLTDDPRNPAPGTFRWACEGQSGPRIVVFRTGGIIELVRTVVVRNADLTIAAQTAPGDGLCLKGSGLSIEASNVIVRGLRSRPGDGPVGTSGQYRRGLQIIGDVSNIIVDHCSSSWGVDDAMTVYADADGRAPRNLTIQWCFLTECLHKSIHQQGPHSAAITMGGGNIGPFSFHHNLLAHNNMRNPRIVWGATGELVNNVIYNWGDQATILEPFNPVKVRKDKRRPQELQPARLNLVGNQWIAGPNSSVKRTEIHLNHATEGTTIYLKGNQGPNRPGPTADGQNENTVMNRARGVASAQPATPLSNVTIESTPVATAAVLDRAGATAPARDTVDQRVAREAKSGTGKIIDSPAQVGGYPNYARRGSEGLG